MRLERTHTRARMHARAHYTWTFIEANATKNERIGKTYAIVGNSAEARECMQCDAERRVYGEMDARG